MARSRMIGVAMGNDGAIHGSPRIDIKIARRAVQSFRTRNDEIHAVLVRLQEQCMTSQ